MIQVPGDLCQHIVWCLENLIVCETEDMEPHHFQDVLPFLILGDLKLMDGAIHLNDQMSLGTVKIDDKAIYGILPPKLVFAQLPIAQ